MKKILLLLPLLLFSMLTFGQKLQWITDKERLEYYPREQYLTGYAINIGRNTKEFSEALKASAKAELAENIQVSVQSAKVNYRSEVDGNFSESFVATTLTFADADLNGLKIEYYYDNNTQTGYAFAYVNKPELRGYYKARITFIIQQIESTLNNAAQLEKDGNKGRAKKMYEEAGLQFNDLQIAQSLLIAVGCDEESMQIEKSLSLKSATTQALAQMQTAIIVYIESREDIFGRQVNILAPKLKALLSQHGCSYTNEQARADWMLSIMATTRRGQEVEGIYFSFLDATVSLIDQHTGKEIYGNNFTDLKGGGLDYESAGRKAYDASLQHISKEIVASIEK